MPVFSWLYRLLDSKLRQTLRQEVADTNPARRIYNDTLSLCETVLEAYLEASKDIVDRRNPLSCRADCHSGIPERTSERCAGDGLERRKTFSKLCTARCHRVLSCAGWSSLEASHILVLLQVAVQPSWGWMIRLNVVVERRLKQREFTVIPVLATCFIR